MHFSAVRMWAQSLNSTELQNFAGFMSLDFVGSVCFENQTFRRSVERRNWSTSLGGEFLLLKEFFLIRKFSFELNWTCSNSNQTHLLDLLCKLSLYATTAEITLHLLYNSTASDRGSSALDWPVLLHTCIRGTNFYPSAGVLLCHVRVPSCPCC